MPCWHEPCRSIAPAKRIDDMTDWDIVIVGRGHAALSAPSPSDA